MTLIPTFVQNLKRKHNTLFHSIAMGFMKAVWFGVPDEYSKVDKTNILGKECLACAYTLEVLKLHHDVEMSTDMESDDFRSEFDSRWIFDEPSYGDFCIESATRILEIRECLEQVDDVVTLTDKGRIVLNEMIDKKKRSA